MYFFRLLSVGPPAEQSQIDTSLRIVYHYPRENYVIEPVFSLVPNLVTLSNPGVIWLFWRFSRLDEQGAFACALFHSSNFIQIAASPVAET